MKIIRIKKGYNLKVAGAPSVSAQKTERPTHLALLPEHIPFVKPRLKVAKGDSVALGSALIEDKRNTDIQFLSPGGGHVADIRFGPRRVIQEIIIQLDETEKAIESLVQRIAFGARPAEPPLAERSGRVTEFFQSFGQGDFARRDRILPLRLKLAIVPNERMAGMLSGH